MSKSAAKVDSNNCLVIVESPTKAKTIRKFLPKSYVVEASMGHIRDLPQSATDIPEKFKKEEWAKIGVNVDQDFEPLYVVPKGKSKVISDLKKKMVNADLLYLATDEDREGESISWHLLEVLKPKIPVKRMVFHEITKSAIERALTETREVDMRLVRAQETRRILDRLVGYTVSPLIWKKIAYGLSAGRVQSAGLRLLVARERERIRFRSANYWDLEAEFEKTGKNGGKFTARAIGLNGKRISGARDFDESTGKLIEKKEGEILVLDGKEASRLRDALAQGAFTVQSVEEKQYHQKPSIPFITSTLQQEANRKLGMGARDAMRTAQSLYEQGFITYMRTDSPNLSSEAIKGARSAVEDLYGKEYLSPEPRQFSSKNKGAQEAHEAIRPAGAEFKHPRETGLSGRELALYEMIWMRTVASQMAEARKLSVVAKIEAKAGADTVLFNANGSRILFPGFLRAYVEGSDDPEAKLEDREVLLPEMKEGDAVAVGPIEALSHITKPPARFTEASLVQQLEKEGIGRPSTYASIIDTILDRGYARKLGNALVPTFTGVAVMQLLENYFRNLVDYKFTSEMEESLDEIAEGKREYLPYLKQFFSGSTGLAEQVKAQEKKIDPNVSRTVELGHLKGVEVKIGRYGAYVVKPGTKTKEEIHATIPDDIAPGDLTETQIEDLLIQSEKGPQSMGKDPKTGMDVYCLSGRFGPYVQLGEVTEEKPKPRRASLLKGMDPKTITLDKALELLSLPRELGIHPEKQKPVLTNLGRFGPYVMCDGDFRSLKKDDNVFTITFDRAMEILREEKRARRGSQALREVGKHEDQPVEIFDGKYGMYVKWGKINATLPKELKPEEITLEQAVELIKARAEQVVEKKPKRGAKKK
ncbi:MAG: type I DNA topoisomerase [Bdellovibrionales bacterium]|nr:type I DNA topoisomerase [Bdellovibrionales bacterium]